MLKYKRMGEQELEASGLPYVIVRPNRLTDGAWGLARADPAPVQAPVHGLLYCMLCRSLFEAASRIAAGSCCRCLC